MKTRLIGNIGYVENAVAESVGDSLSVKRNATLSLYTNFLYKWLGNMITKRAEVTQ